MTSEVFPDGSVAHYYEVGDLVRFIKTDWSWSCWHSHEVGDWGRVTRVRGKPIVAMLDIYLAGYCRPKDSFFTCAGSIPCWNVEPYIPEFKHRIIVQGAKRENRT